MRPVEAKTQGEVYRLRALDAAYCSVSPDEKAMLVKYVGWGAMPQVFDVDSANWAQQQIQLPEILSDEEHLSARRPLRSPTIAPHFPGGHPLHVLGRAAFSVFKVEQISNQPAASATSSGL